MTPNYHTLTHQPRLFVLLRYQIQHGMSTLAEKDVSKFGTLATRISSLRSQFWNASIGTIIFEAANYWRMDEH